MVSWFRIGVDAEGWGGDAEGVVRKSRSSHLDRVLGRLDDLDSVNLAIVVQRLARERSLLEAVFHTVQEGILVINLAGVIEYANAAAHALIGLREGEVGQAVLWRLVPELQGALRGYFSADAGVRPLAVTRELEIAYPERRQVRLYLVPLRSSEADLEAENTARMALILTDISADHSSTAQLIESERLRSIFELAAGVAHEIGNPLNSINIHLQLLSRQTAKLASGKAREKIEQSLAVCTQEIQRLDGIIRHFLEAIQPQTPDLRDLAILDVLTSVLEVLRPELENRRIRVEVETEEALPLIAGDLDRLKQVFYNLLKNSLEAMAAGGQLRLDASSDDDFLRVRVADTGCGIQPEDLPDVFKPFHSSKASGHGLGMMVVQRIVHEHGGQIGIDSQPGKGTVVTVQFPQKHRRIRLLQATADGN